MAPPELTTGTRSQVVHRWANPVVELARARGGVDLLVVDLGARGPPRRWATEAITAITGRRSRRNHRGVSPAQDRTAVPTATKVDTSAAATAATTKSPASAGMRATAATSANSAAAPQAMIQTSAGSMGCFLSCR
ncbi:hypothetical protein Ae706Ps2_5996 [Pseudonocardia sp. Ae706_Ps2]|nr:hypothetical protein Ae331Ps2_5951 [Pseudonocardia sp. Ae331_Ps2]OLM09534.1 hypothetical protein Ae706Ps2_5996 [Pseudonocardia sp. Ae706_Ps2]